MRALVVDPIEQDRCRSESILRGAGYSVVPQAELGAAQVELDQRVPDIMILDPTLDPSGALALVRRLRGEPSEHVHVLLVSPRLSSAVLGELLASGADDFMNKPIHADELLFRVAARERLARWAPAYFGGMAPSRSPVAVTSLEAWSAIDARAAGDVGRLLGCPMSSEPAPNPTAACDHVAELSLTTAERGLDVRFTVGAPTEALRELSRHLFGAELESPEELGDVTRELANLIAGRFKGAAGGEAVSLTMGLPASGSSHRPPRTTLASRSFVLRDPKATIAIAIVVDVLASQLRHFRLGDLKEGMMLAHPVFDERGGLLVPAGRLTELRIARVIESLPPHAEVEVADEPAHATEGP